MPHRLILVLATAIVLGGCARVADSRLNPFNWFGGGEEEGVETVEVVETDPRARVAQITELVVERTPTGAIVRATALPPTQGWYDAALVAAEDAPVNGAMVYVFRAFPPDGPRPVSTVRSRELTAARALSPQDLAQIRIIRVEGALNARTARR
ncbi:MAG: hypothetical protein QNJ20_18905 [Paracoccaceae bacterium]|nr:hypothetical protein [Paracoccaceae bacterium]